MKKTYTSPTIELYAIHSAGIMATSIPVKGESDVEARSRDFWGLPEDDDDTDNDGTSSWF